MTIGGYVFFISLFVLVYTYAGYGLIIYVAGRIRNRKTPPPLQKLPSVTLIVPAYNEATTLEAKIHNCLSLSYPPGQLNFIFITDGSTDGSEQLVQGHPQITLLHEPQRLGKMAAINRSMQYVNTPVVVFCDANTTLNKDCLLEIVKHYADEAVGGVAGEKKIAGDNGTIAMGEGLYWKYESLLKQLDSDLNTVIGAAGELFSMRTSLFKPLPADTILDDFMLSMQICAAGYKVVYEPGAFAIEPPSATMAEERQRRVRIAAGAFQSIPRIWQHKFLIKRPLLYFQYFSRRILRWTACPVAMFALYISNAAIVASPGADPFFAGCWIAQNCFYLAALVGAITGRYRGGRLFFLPFYFVFMHVSLVEGFFRFISGNQSVLWEKARRTAISTSP